MKHHEKVENQKLKKYIKIFKRIYKNGKNIRFDDIEIQKQKFHQHKYTYFNKKYRY